MKRQRKTKQIKEQDKCPPNQTKEEEIGSLPEKESRIMIVKMIQNLENKMELQISSLETRIEKDLEEDLVEEPGGRPLSILESGGLEKKNAEN